MNSPSTPSTPSVPSNALAPSASQVAISPPAGASPTAARAPVPEETGTFAASSSSQADDPSQGATIYVVKDGDTLSVIARQWGTTVASLMETNQLTSDVIYVWQELKVASPAPSSPSPAYASQPAAGVPTVVLAPGTEGVAGAREDPGTYVVQAGDTLLGVAQEFALSPEALAEANGISPDDMLYVDQVLTIPARGRGGGATNSAAKTADATLTPRAAPTTVPGTTPPRTPPATPTAAIGKRREPVIVKGRTYDAYNPAVIKKGQFYQYTCEFDAAWVVLKTYGYDVSLDEQVEIVGLDTSIEPYYKQTENGVVIYGGDVARFYSGDYKKNFLARSSGQAMRKVFEHYGLHVTPVRDRPGLEAAALRGELVWIKTTVDFKKWVPATWVMPDGRSYQTVLGNDHALVVMGFNKDAVVVRDPLGPTSTNRQRLFEYEVPWPKFLASWGAQEFDGLAVMSPGR